MKLFLIEVLLFTAKKTPGFGWLIEFLEGLENSLEKEKLKSRLEAAEQAISSLQTQKGLSEEEKAGLAKDRSDLRIALIALKHLEQARHTVRKKHGISVHRVDNHVDSTEDKYFELIEEIYKRRPYLKHVDYK